MAHISVIPVKLAGGEPFATLAVRIYESDTFYMLIDTGSTRTVVTPRVSERLRLGVRPGLAVVAGGQRVVAVAVTAIPCRRDNLAVVAGGQRVVAGRAAIASLEIEGFKETRVENLPVRVLALPFGDGALGLDYLRHFAEVCYSFAESALKLTSY